ncbi:MAG: FAD-dependent monooxygenase [Acidobacteriota bacterium]|nr:FAD-dependent monooxygenase [Acidobacteriota bacterium]
MTDHAVVVVGAGPTGLMLAGELALAGIDVAVVERRAGQELDRPRALGLHARTIEVLDQRGIADRFLAAGRPVQVQAFSMIPLDIGDFPTRHPYGLALPQNEFEPILAEWVGELGVRAYRTCEVTGFAQDDAGVEVALSDGRTLRARYLAGCDGGRSVVRRAAGIDFPGWDPSVNSLIAEVEMREEPQAGIRRDANGTQAMRRLDDGTRVAVVVTERFEGQSDEPTLEDLRAALRSVWGTDFGAHSPTFVSRFTDMARQAASYRAGRVLLAGDAAHIHYPVSGQGLNLGVQDAVNLGWKLAEVIEGHCAEGLLDTYHAERHPVAAGVLQSTMAQTALNRSDARMDALRTVVTELLGMDEPRRRMAARVSGLDVHYDLGPGHPLLGRRMPDVDLDTEDGARRMYSFLHEARPVLLNLGARGRFDLGPWAGRVRLVEAACEGGWALPALGEVTAPGAVLVRPDGHVAWVEEGSEQSLPDALTAWFGPR